MADLWVLMMNLWASGSHEFSSQDIDDCRSEMMLRRIDPPFDRVSQIWERIAQRTQNHVETIINDPEALAAAEAKLEKQLEQLRQQLEHPQH
ncbi:MULTISPECIES: hypothetical protein [unclassified Bradyrhizobium]|uniref:hypothetical protein n=2 Tax=Bradyrhizobium TaxID=374 RepID=UPI002915F1E7|nr:MULTISPECIES: hypothetical protein [unclassified Bradyrhizobium]